MPKYYRSPGAAVDACLRIATEEWFRQHRGLRSREEAAVEDFRLLSATLEKRPRNRLRIHVGIVTNDRRTTETQMYDFQLDAKQGYVQTELSNRKH